ncbi:MAG: DNA primase, partial [Bacteroidota bacterium]
LTTESGQSQKQTEFEELFAACKFAAQHFYKNLDSPEGKSALEYFHSRGFSDATINSFGLGYSKNSWDGLLTAAQQEGIPVAHLVKAGLVRARDDGSGHYDYFRGRAMFPIFSATGRVIAFGARKMREDDPIQGKYINSPETPVYNKSRVLFGLFQSKEAIRAEETALMVEGYADLISLFQAGVQNVVASSGTALTEEQVKLVGKYARTIVLVYDADSAGSQAALRGLDIALEQGLDVHIASLPPGHDPDSFVRKQGAKEFRTLVEQAVSFIDFKAGMFAARGRFATPEGKTEAVRSIVQSIAKINDELKRNFFVKAVADKYQIYESVLYRELERWVARDKPPIRGSSFQDRRAAAGTNQAPPAVSLPTAEREILRIVCENRTALINEIFSAISVDDLSDARVRKLVQIVLERIENTGSVDSTALVNELEDPDLKSVYTDVMLSRYDLSKGWQEMEVEIEEPDPAKIAKAAVAAIKRKALRTEIEQNHNLMSAAKQRGEETRPFIERHQELSRTLRNLESVNSKSEIQNPKQENQNPKF